MIKVLYDYQAFSMQQHGGISRYFANLHSQLANGLEVKSSLGVRYSRNQYLKNYSQSYTPFFSSLLSNHKMYKLNRAYSKYLIGKNDFQLFHPTYYEPYFLSLIKKPFILTVHDMIHEIFPEYFSHNDLFAQYKRKLVEKASHIIAISNSTKNDLQNMLGVLDEKVTVVYHGYKEIGSKMLLKNFNPPFPNYILFIGERRVYKNFSNFIEGVRPVLDKHKDIQVICAGGGGFGTAEIELFARNKLQNRITQITASDGELSSLYKHALAFVFPSLYEGFGFPLLEAFAKECPVVCTDGNSFREIAGVGALYFNPRKPDEIAEKVSLIIENSDLADELRKSGLVQLKKFSMESCVNNTAEVYKKISALI